MNIAPYAAYFHDGSIIDIQYSRTELLISMESAELSTEDLLEHVTLSDDGALKGILHIQGISAVLLNNQPFNNPLVIQTDWAEILDFSITDNRVHFFIEWKNCKPSKQLINDEYTDIVIEAKQLYWENIPDLYDPFR